MADAVAAFFMIFLTFSKYNYKAMNRPFLTALGSLSLLTGAPAQAQDQPPPGTTMSVDTVEFADIVCQLRDIPGYNLTDQIIIIDKNDANDSGQSTLTVFDTTGAGCSEVLTTPILYGRAEGGGDYMERADDTAASLRTRFLTDSQREEQIYSSPAGNYRTLELVRGESLADTYNGSSYITLARGALYGAQDGQLTQDAIAIHSYCKGDRDSLSNDGDPSNDAETHGCFDICDQGRYQTVFDIASAGLSDNDWSQKANGTLTAQVNLNVFVLPVGNSSIQNALAMNGFDPDEVIKEFEIRGAEAPWAVIEP